MIVGGSYSTFPAVPQSGINAVVGVSLAAVITEPVTVDFVKSYSRIDFDDEDTLILESFIPSAREILEKYCNRSFVNRQVVALVTNSCGMQELPYGPVNGNVLSVTDNEGNAITEVKYTGVDGFLSVESPRQESMTFTYQGGHNITNPLPAALKLAIAAQANWMFEHRGDEAGSDYEEIAPAAKQYCKLFRRVFTELFL